MRQEKVSVIIDKKTGTVKIEADGFEGTGCDALNDLEMALGSQISRQDKDERYIYRNPDLLPNQLC